MISEKVKDNEDEDGKEEEKQNNEKVVNKRFVCKCVFVCEISLSVDF